MRIKNRLEEIRWELRISKGQLAASLGTSPQQLSRWINQREQPSNVWMLRIAQALGRPVEDIFYLTD